MRYPQTHLATDHAWDDMKAARVSKPYPPPTLERHGPNSTANWVDFGSPAIIAAAVDPWLCVPVFQQVCPYRSSMGLCSGLGLDLTNALHSQSYSACPHVFLQVDREFGKYMNY